jgi:hypothetical protein
MVGARRLAVLLACLGLALALVVVALSASARAPSFARSFLGTADSPAVAIGDLNGDRRADIVTANYNPESISVNLNRGGGRFTGREYPVGGLARSVAIGDLNGDGKPDVVTANDTIDTPYTVSVLLNGGDGRLAGRHDYQVAKPAGVAIADLNGDDKPELAIASDVTNAVSVLRNRGDGTFLAGSAYYATGRRPVYLTSSDFNGDGRLDLATANADADTVSVLLNQGDGTLQASYDYASERSPSSIAIADLNGDRHPDLATANRGAGTLSVLLGRGDGSFQPKRDYRTGSGPFSIVIGDLNGDNLPDLAAANSGSGTLSVLPNRGDGSFRPKLDYVPGPELYGGSIAIGDLNGDRRLDLAVPIIYSRNGATDLSLLINTPGLCNVQRVRGMTLSAAKDTLARINCRLGKVSRADSRSIKRGRVISQKPGFGAVLPKGTKVNLVVSRGRKH